MKSNLLLLMFLSTVLMQTLVHAQVAPLWTQTINSTPDSASIYPVKILNDNQGNVLVLCTYRKNVGASNIYKTYLNKYNYNGVLIWNYVFDNGGAGDPLPQDMAIDNLDNIYIAGGFASVPGNKPFLIALNASGSLNWQRDTTTSFSTGNYFQVIVKNSKIHLASVYGIAVYSGSGNELWSASGYVSRIAVDNNGRLIVGYNTPANSTVVRYDANGNINFSDSTITPERIAVDVENNIYLFTQFPEYTLVKMDSTGIIQWQKDSFPVPPPFGDISFDVLTDYNSDVILTGLSDTLIKFSGSGQQLWKKGMNGLDQYIHSAKMFYNDLYVAGIQQGSGGYDIHVASFNSYGIQNWHAAYSSNNTSEFAKDMSIDANGIYVLEDSASNSTVIKFPLPDPLDTIDYNFICVDSVWYDNSNPGLVNISVYNGGVVQLNYPSMQIISPAGDTISNKYNLVNFFAHLSNTSQVYTDTISVPGISDFSNYHFIIYDGFGTTAGEIGFCTTLNMESREFEFIKLFPNPAQDFLNVSGLNNNKKYSFDLYDLNGRRVGGGKLSATDNGRIDVSGFSNGIYFLKLQSPGAEKNIKVIISR